MTELGQTHDPVQLVPGDPAAIRGNAQALQARSAHAEQAGNGLVDIDTGAWTGAAGDAFRDKFSYEPNKWYAAANSLATAGDALNTYAQTLQWAQGRRRRRSGSGTRQRRSRPRPGRRSEQAAAQAAPGQTLPAFTDPGDAGRQAAQDTLRRARDQVATAGDAAARFCPRKPTRRRRSPAGWTSWATSRRTSAPAW
jgi:uncharacterized protein YukE